MFSVRSRTSWTISWLYGSGFGPCALRLCTKRFGRIAEDVMTKAPCNARRVALRLALRHSIVAPRMEFHNKVFKTIYQSSDKGAPV